MYTFIRLIANTGGLRCERCRIGFYGSPESSSGCTPCKCNGHSQMCDTITGRCYCDNSTTGKHCELCALGYFGNAKYV